MKVTTTHLEHGIGLVTVEGSFIDEGSAQMVDEAVAKITAGDHPNLIIDLDKVTFLSSKAIGELVRAHVTTMRKGGKLVVCGLNERVYTMLTVTKLNMVLHTARALEEAKKSFA